MSTPNCLLHKINGGHQKCQENIDGKEKSRYNPGMDKEKLDLPRQYLSWVRVIGALYIISSLAAVISALLGEHKIVKPVFTDYIYYLLMGGHFLWGILLFSHRRGSEKFFKSFLFIPELLLSISLLLFAFSYLYALSANMDYVQRFIATGGNLRLAIDTKTERFIAIIRYMPVIVVGIIGVIVPRIRFAEAVRKITGSVYGLTGWGLGWVFLSIALTVLSHPSFVFNRGLPALGWICMIPLFIVMKEAKPGRAVFYGIVYGVFTTALINFWLGTFSLISLQVIILIYFVFYSIFIPILVFLYRRITIANFLVFPLGWLLFDYIRTTGFLGYPWGMLALSQYSVLPVIQISALTGIWGLNFIIIFFNNGMAEILTNRIKGRNNYLPGIISAYFTAAAFLLGALVLLFPGQKPTDTMRAALIQQNSDPRKNDYEETFDSLVRLTDSALKDNPKLVVWPETAYVPNISRWSAEDPSRFSERSWQQGLISLTRRFISYQNNMETALLTGNDDYENFIDEKGQEIRFDYNAAVLFSAQGERIETYHKIRLVPFTEHFPYKEQLPGVYKLLTDFDVNFWIPGEEKTVFQLDPITFSTPICFEDAFPNEVRQFVKAGSEVIINISNDYWSLTDVQGWQHFSASLFRAVENRRHLLRSTTSGITAWVDPYGRIMDTLPAYREDYLIVDLPVLEDTPTTLYTRWGDWFPYTCGAVLAFLLLLSLWRVEKEQDNTIM